MTQLGELLSKQPLVPYIRAAGFAVRKPWTVERRRLLDYLLVFFQEGRCVVELDGIEHAFGPGEFCLVQPGDVHRLHGLTDTITPYAHLDIFYHARREESFSSPPGLLDLSPHQHLMQPRLNDIRAFMCRCASSRRMWRGFAKRLLRMVGVWQQHDPLSQLEAQNLGRRPGVIAAARLQRRKRAHRAGTALAELDYILFAAASGRLHFCRGHGQTRAAFSFAFCRRFRQTFGCAPHATCCIFASDTRRNCCRIPIARWKAWHA
jgi:hypothetical protein